MLASRYAASVITVAFIAALGACSAKVDGIGGSGSAQTVGVEVVPNSTGVFENQGAQFAAAVTGTSNTTVTWEVVEASGGTVNGSGLYTAPGTAGTFHVRAVSSADPSVSAVATVTVTPPPAGSVTISPKTIALVAGGTTTFTATATNLSSSAVSWRVQESSGCGSVTSGGVYTAPAAAATCHVVATSAVDGTASDVATVTVTAAPVVTVAISPTTLTLDACTAHTFTATVSGSTDTAVVWSVTEGAAGGQVSGGVYTAPSTPGTYHVVATAHASSTVRATATVTVSEHVLAIAVDPSSVSLTPAATQKFTAMVTTTCGTFAVQ